MRVSYSIFAPVCLSVYFLIFKSMSRMTHGVDAQGGIYTTVRGLVYFLSSICQLTFCFILQTKILLDVCYSHNILTN